MLLAAWAVFLAELIAIGYLVRLFVTGDLVIVFDKGTDIAAVTLTAATLVLTGVGVMVAVVTVWGYREIRERAVQAAVDAALKAVGSTVRGAYTSGENAPTPEDANKIATAMAEDASKDGR